MRKPPFSNLGPILTYHFLAASGATTSAATIKDGSKEDIRIWRVLQEKNKNHDIDLQVIASKKNKKTLVSPMRNVKAVTVA